MKKIILSSLIGLALLLSACGGGSSSNSNDSSNEETTTNTKLATMAVVSGHYDRDYWNKHFSDVVFADTNNWAILTKTLPFNEKMIIDLGLESRNEENMAQHNNPASMNLTWWYRNKGYIYLRFKNQNGTTIHTFKFDKSGHHDSGYIEFDGDMHNDSNAELRSVIQGFIRIENNQLKFIGEYNNKGDYTVGISSKTWNMSRFNEIKKVEISIKVLHTYEPAGEARIPLYIEYQERNDNQNSVNNPPTVNAGEDKSVIVNEPITITGIANDSDGEIVAYEWKEGNRLLATTASFEYLPTTTGTHTLTLTVTDNDGVTTSDSLVVTVTNDISTLSDGLVAYYKFDGNANDSSGNGNDGVEHGGVAYVDGVIGRASYFDGVSDYINIAYNNSLAPKSYSVSVFYKSFNINYKGEIICNGIDKHYYQIQFNSEVSEKKIEFWYENSNDDDFYILSSDGFDTEWHMATMIFDNNTSTLKAYIDGVLVKSKIFNSKPYNNNEEFWIARGNNGYFNGLIDDLRIYNRALSESEIQELYQMGNP